jgi:hypothetical protein
LIIVSADRLLIHTLSKVEKEGLPREQPVLHLLLRMLALGLSAWEMIETQDFRDIVAIIAEISAA